MKQRCGSDREKKVKLPKCIIANNYAMPICNICKMQPQNLCIGIHILCFSCVGCWPYNIWTLLDSHHYFSASNLRWQQQLDTNNTGQQCQRLTVDCWGILHIEFFQTAICLAFDWTLWAKMLDIYFFFYFKSFVAKLLMCKNLSAKSLDSWHCGIRGRILSFAHFMFV